VSAASQPGWREWLLDAAPGGRTQARLGRWFRFWLAFRRNAMGMVGLVIVLALVVIALGAPVVFDEQDALTQHLTERLLPPSPQFLFGTDELGRDIFLRVMFGAKTTLTIAALVAVIVLPVGLAIGIVAGYFGGWIDTVLMRITDVFLGFPKLVLALAFAAALGPGLENAVVAIALTAWPPYARLARSECASLRHREFVEASVLQGASASHIILKDIAPLCMPSAIVRLTLDMSGVILTAAGLGFLGLGAQPPAPEWGAMVSTGRQVLFDQWWVSTIPGLAIFLASLGFNLLGDGLRDQLGART